MIRALLILCIPVVVACGGPNPTAEPKNVVVDAVSTPSRALLYLGPGVWDRDIADLPPLLSGAGIPFDAVTSLVGVNYSQYRAILMPGGWAPDIGSGISSTERTRLKQAISGGLNYLGTCAGAFLTGSYLPQYLHLFNVALDYPSFYYAGTKQAMLGISLWNGTNTSLLYDMGPNLSPIPRKTTLGRFSNGTAAIVQTSYGLGKVVLSAVHPEASLSTIGALGLSGVPAPSIELSLIQMVLP